MQQCRAVVHRMAHQITFGSERVLANNQQFASLFEFAVRVGEESCRTLLDRSHVTRMRKLMDEEFWPGRDVEIERDFPDTAERKFWSSVFYDTARLVFERKIGNHEHTFWQAQCIWQAYGLGRLFQEAVRSNESGWSAPSRDHIDFERIVNGRDMEDR